MQSKAPRRQSPQRLPRHSEVSSFSSCSLPCHANSKSQDAFRAEQVDFPEWMLSSRGILCLKRTNGDCCKRPIGEGRNRRCFGIASNLLDQQSLLRVPPNFHSDAKRDDLRVSRSLLSHVFDNERKPPTRFTSRLIDVVAEQIGPCRLQKKPVPESRL